MQPLLEILRKTTDFFRAKGIESARRIELLDILLREGDTTQRTQAAELIARLPGEEARTRLEAALEKESEAAIQGVIKLAISQIK